MTAVSSLLLFKFVLTTGLALWATVIALNNVINFAGGVAALGGLMNMQLFDQAPAIRTPLLARRVASPVWHRLVYSFVLLVEIIVALLFWYAVIGFLGALFGSAGAADAIARATLALAGFIAMSFIFALGGAWFVYYIRQDVMQLTHFALIAAGVAATIVINLPAG